VNKLVRPLTFSPDGRTLATAGIGATVKLWDAATGKEKATLKGHTKLVAAVAFSQDGRALTSGSYDKTIKLRDLGATK
jgi:WD40 repeat protein